MPISSTEVSKIKRLKELFDEGSLALRTDYWTEELLQTYSESLGERIRWKWDAFLADLKSKSIHPEQLLGEVKSFMVQDWGCGPGTASISLVDSFRDASLLSFAFEDRSTLAKNFASRRLFKKLGREPNRSQVSSAPSLLLISYVMSELDAREEKKLVAKILEHDMFCWVDSAAYAESRKLSGIRNLLLEQFEFLSPCPHQKTCPLSENLNPGDWCHRFVKAPQEVFHSAKWADFSKHLGIDLKSLPFASLYGVKKTLLAKIAAAPQPADQPLGRPRVGKHEITLDFCTTEGVYQHRKLTKRAEPAEFKRLKKQF